MSKKEAILQAAAMLFSKRGFKDTSIAELSKMTGAAQGTIFYHFKNKEELFLSILESLKESITAQFQDYLKEKKFKTGLDMMEGAISFYFYMAGTNGDQFLLLHRHDAYEVAESNPACREHLEGIYNCLLDIFEQAVRLGQKDGSIGEMPARKIALIIFCMVDGLVRFNTYNLYDAGSLYNEIMASCRRMLKDNRSIGGHY
jgi:AcrR family transcriptional regulator